LNKVETQFADTPPSDASATPPSNGLVPGPTSSAKSEVHAVIISGNTRAENVIVGQTLISLTGGIVALGNSSPIQQSTVLTGAVTTNFDKGVILKAWGRNQPQQLSLIKK
jgi:hypothetical protein